MGEMDLDPSIFLGMGFGDFLGLLYKYGFLTFYNLSDPFIVFFDHL